MDNRSDANRFHSSCPTCLVRRYGLIVVVSPMEEIIVVEIAFTGIGEVHGIVRVHRHEDLYRV